MSLLSLGNDALLHWVVGFPVASPCIALVTAALSYPVFRLFRAKPPVVKGSS